MSDVTLRNIPEDLLLLLRKRALLEHRTVTDEVVAILSKDLEKLRERSERFQNLFQQIRELSGDRFTDVPSPEEMIREDRDR